MWTNGEQRLPLHEETDPIVSKVSSKSWALMSLEIIPF